MVPRCVVRDRHLHRSAAGESPLYALWRPTVRGRWMCRQLGRCRSASADANELTCGCHTMMDVVGAGAQSSESIARRHNSSSKLARSSDAPSVVSNRRKVSATDSSGETRAARQATAPEGPG